jgi:hypothetical protein
VIIQFEMNPYGVYKIKRSEFAENLGELWYRTRVSYHQVERIKIRFSRRYVSEGSRRSTEQESPIASDPC